MNLLKYTLGIIAIIIFSYGSTNIDTYSKEGISFSYPTDWYISEEEELDEDSYYLSLEKRGENESGLITITWFNGYIDHQQYLSIIQNEYSNQETFEELNFKAAKKKSFNKLKATKCDFSFTAEEVKYKGDIHLIYKSDKTISIIRQGSTEDAKKNKNGFKQLEAKFNVK